MSRLQAALEDSNEENSRLRARVEELAAKVRCKAPPGCGLRARRLRQTRSILGSGSRARTHTHANALTGGVSQNSIVLVERAAAEERLGDVERSVTSMRAKYTDSERRASEASAQLAGALARDEQRLAAVREVSGELDRARLAAVRAERSRVATERQLVEIRESVRARGGLRAVRGPTVL